MLMLLGVSEGSAAGGAEPSSRRHSGETTKAAGVKCRLRLLLVSFFACLYCCYSANSDQWVRLESCALGALLGAGRDCCLLMEMQVELVKGTQRSLVSKRPSRLQIKATSPACFAPELGMLGLQRNLPSARGSSRLPASLQSTGPWWPASHHTVYKAQGRSSVSSLVFHRLKLPHIA